MPVLTPPPLLFLFFTKMKFVSKKLVLNEYKICLKCWNGHFRDSNLQKFLGTQTPYRKFMPLAVVVPPPWFEVLDPPLINLEMLK